MFSINAKYFHAPFYDNKKNLLSNGSKADFDALLSQSKTNLNARGFRESYDHTSYHMIIKRTRFSSIITSLKIGK